MRVLLLCLIILLPFSGKTQPTADFIVTSNGDSIFGKISFDRDWYRPKKHINAQGQIKNYIYNGYHGIIIVVGKDSFAFYTASQILNYYQASTYRPNKWFFRPEGTYFRFDLRKKASLSNNDILRYRYILGTPATSELLDYPIKYNTPYMLYFTYIAGKHGQPYLAYILSKDDEAYLLGYPHNLSKLARRKGIPDKMWRKGGGNFVQKVLRLQFALNHVAS